MAELLEEQSKAIVTSEAPRFSISGEKVAQPYIMLGHALDKLGEGLEAVATPLAEKAGAETGKKMVTRNEAGEIEIVPQSALPVFGSAGNAYARAVKVGALAEADGAAKRADIELRQRYRDNPEGYQQAAEDFKNKMVDKMTAAAGPEVGNALGAAIDSTTTFTYRGLTGEKERLDLARAEGSMKARMDEARDNAMAMGRGGIGADDPAMQKAVGTYMSVADERMRNPRLSYTKEQHDLDIKQFKSEIGGQVYVHDTEQDYKERGIEAAEEKAKDILTSPKYAGLEMGQRQQYYHQALGAIRTDEAIRKQDLGVARQALVEFQLAAHEGMPMDYGEGDKLVQTFYQLGDPAGAARAASTLLRLPMNRIYGGDPIREQTRQINGYWDKMSAPEEYRPLIKKASEISGFDPATLSRMLYTENRFRPTGTSPAGAEGVAQFMPRTAAEYGIDPNKPEQAIPAAGRLLHDLSLKYEGNQGMALAAYNWGQGNLDKWKAAGAHMEDMPAETRNYVEKITGVPVSTWLGGRGRMVPDITSAASMWHVANMQRELNKDAWEEWKVIRKDYDSEHIVPSLDTIKKIHDAAFATGNHMLLDTIEHDTQRMDIARVFTGESLSKQDYDIGRFQQLATMRETDPGHAAILKDFIAINSAVTEGLKDNPIRTTANYLADQPGVRMPPPLNVADQDEFRVGLKQRAQLADLGARNWETGRPLSALDKPEVDKIAGVLDTADVPTKARILGDITKSLPEDVRNATLAKLGEKDKMMTTVAAAALQPEAPDVAMSILRGEQAVKVDPRNSPLADSNNKLTFEQSVDQYLPATLFPVERRTDPKGPFAQMRGAVSAIVADKLADPTNAKKEVTKDMVKQAVQDVTGGTVASPGGTEVIVPTRGMNQGQFDGVLYGLKDADFATASTLSGEPITAAYVRNQGDLESFGDGRYRIKVGNSYVFQGASEMSAAALRPFILDLRNRMPDPGYRRPPVSDFSVPSAAGIF